MRNTKAIHLYRATIMNHPGIVEKRNVEIRKNCLSKLHTMEEENTKLNEKISANRDVASIILKTIISKRKTK